MSFYQLPNPWNPGYALPDYVLAEQPGRGTFTTAMLPRRTVSVLPPDYLAQPVATPGGVAAASSLSGHTLDKPTLQSSTLTGSSLGDDTLGARARTRQTARRDARYYKLSPAPTGDFPGGSTLPALALVGAALWILGRKRR